MPNVFIDSNLWIYALIEEEESRDKTGKMVSFLETLKKNHQIVISIQVLNEFHWTLKRKYKIEESQIREKVLEGITGIAQVTPINLEQYKKAFDIRDKYNVSYWDSIIIASALSEDCIILYSEDMHHELKVEDKLLIKNPFKAEI